MAMELKGTEQEEDRADWSILWYTITMQHPPSAAEQWAEFLKNPMVQNTLESALSDTSSERPDVQPASDWTEFISDPAVQEFLARNLPYEGKEKV
ncbi:MAG: hypothetical protein AAB728_00830 [Patescibacteria group bacterium]